MTVASRFDVYVRDQDMVEVGILAVAYRKFTADLRLMAAGGSPGMFEVTVGADAPGLRFLFDAGNPIEGMGLVVRRPGGAVVCSGDIDSGQISVRPGGDTVIPCRPDDTILGDEIAYPDPTTDTSTSSTELSDLQDIRTGPGGEVLAAFLAANIGPAAGVTRRRYPWLTIPSATGVGTSGTWKARDDVLIDLANKIASNSGVAWTLRQADTGSAVQVDIWEPTQLEGITFSPSRGDVTDVVIRYTARRTDEVIVAADVGVDRLRTRRSTSIPAGRRRHVKWVSSSSTDLTEMRQAADQTLTEGSASIAATVTLTDSPTAIYGVDWRLGDIVTAATWDTATVTSQVIGVTVNHDPGMPHPRWATSLGDLDPNLPRIPSDQVRRSLDNYLRGQ